MSNNIKHKVHHARKRKNKTKMTLLGVGCGIISAALIFVAVWAVFLRDGKNITGKGGSLYKEWKIDSTTHYRFEEGGRGALVLPSEEFPFSFRIEENRISIDFDDESCIDKNYTFSVIGDILTLTFDNDHVYNLSPV